MHSAVSTLPRRKFLAIGGLGVVGALMSRSITSGAAAAFSPTATASLPLTGQTALTPAAIATTTAKAAVAPTPPTVTIPVPVIQQSMVLDCETAALQQGLAYYGYNVSQAELFSHENPDTRMPVMGANHTVLQWGNPYTNFVGYVNGSDYTPTGFGVFWPVILRLAQDYGLPNAIGGEGFAPGDIYAALGAGHPVQVWIETNFLRVPVGTWTAWDGTKVRYSYAEHSVTLSGVSPTQVRVNDVLNASQYWVDKSLFEANFADFNNMAVIFQ